MGPTIEALLETSAVLAGWPARERSWLLATVAALGEAPDGLPLDALVARIDGHDRTGRVDLSEALSRILTGVGLFRPTPKGRYALRPSALLARSIESMPLAIVDLEATGGRPPLHRPIEVALIRREPDGRRSTYTSIANPGRPLPPFVATMTGLSPEDLRRAPDAATVVEELLARAGDALLVFHGAPQDWELINYEVHSLTGRFVENPVCCTIALVRHLQPDLSTTGLDNVARHLGLAVEELHRASADAQLTLAVYDRLREGFDAAGIRTLADLSFFQGALPRPPFLDSNISVALLGSLPRAPGAYVLRDGRGTTLLARATADLGDELRSFFFPRGAIPPPWRHAHRAARTLDFRVASDLAAAREVLGLLHEGSARRRGPTRHRRHHGAA